jgi:hypothetical protein
LRCVLRRRDRLRINIQCRPEERAFCDPC